MKKLLVGLFVFGSLSTFAFHIEESDKFINVGRIESIKLIKTLNIKPNTSSTKLGSCELKHDSVNYDRSLTMPRSFEYVGLEVNKYIRSGWAGNPIGTLKIKFSGLNSASEIHCDNVYYNTITVSGVRDLLVGFIEFTLSKPVEMD